MGTNFYHRNINYCECCGRSEERHICKSMVSFQGYRPDPDCPGDPTPAITSWQEWKAALRADGEVWDEYGRRIPTEEFIADVESTERPRRRRQYDWMVNHYGHDAGGHDWLDEDGFSFTDVEFS